MFKVGDLVKFLDTSSWTKEFPHYKDRIYRVSNVDKSYVYITPIITHKAINWGAKGGGFYEKDLRKV